MEHANPEGTRPPEYVVGLWAARELRARNARIQKALAEAHAPGNRPAEDQRERQVQEREAEP